MRPALALASLLALVAAASPASAARIRVRGTAKLTARASRDVAGGASELVLGGQLTDDAGQALAGAPITVRLGRELDAADPRVAAALRGARRCERPGNGGLHASSVRVAGTAEAPELVATTDDEGRFCLRARLEPDRYKASLVYVPPGAAALVDGTTRDLVFDLSKHGLELRFEPAPRVLALDTPQATFEAVAVLDADATPRVAPGLALVLGNETEELARATTNASGRARFVLPGGRLGAPGLGELRLAFEGDAAITRAIAAEEVERHVKVSLRVPAADRGELAPSTPEDGVALAVSVTSSAGPVGEGTVEARIGDVLVGAAPVDRGVAHVLATFTSHAGATAPVRLRYVPVSPWFEPLGEPVVEIPVKHPSVLTRAPLLAAGVLVLVFFLLGRLSARRGAAAAPTPEPKRGAEPAGVPRLEVVRSADRADHGFTGVVLDAHEGRPLPGVRIWVERGAFDGKTILASVESGPDGRFALPAIGPVTGNETIAAEGRFHARLGQPLPAPGELEIALVERRRALLASLVAWAKRRGPPFDVRPEPTPGHVKRVGSAEEATVRWADAVERAAFGPGEVDAGAEQEIERLAPDERR